MVFMSSLSEKTERKSYIRAIERGKNSYTKVFTANIARVRERVLMKIRDKHTHTQRGIEDRGSIAV